MKSAEKLALIYFLVVFWIVTLGVGLFFSWVYQKTVKEPMIYKRMCTPTCSGAAKIAVKHKAGTYTLDTNNAEFTRAFLQLNPSGSETTPSQQKQPWSPPSPALLVERASSQTGPVIFGVVLILGGIGWLVNAAVGGLNMFAYGLGAGAVILGVVMLKNAKKAAGKR